MTANTAAATAAVLDYLRSWRTRGLASGALTPDSATVPAITIEAEAPALNFSQEEHPGVVSSKCLDFQS